MKIKINPKQDWIIWLMLALPFAVIAYFWNRFPEQVPMHWNVSGQVDRYDPKFPGLFFGPIFNIALYIVFLILPAIDPKGKNYARFAKVYQIIKVGTATFLTFIFMLVAAISLGVTINVMYAVIAPIILLFLIMGNFMGTIKPNYFVGIRLPWTLNNDEVWRLTHRLAGFVWVWASLLMLALIFVMPENIMVGLFWVYVVAITLIPSFYSFFIHKKITANIPEAEK